jgi:hypothetical protein
MYFRMQKGSRKRWRVAVKASSFKTASNGVCMKDGEVVDIRMNRLVSEERSSCDKEPQTLPTCRVVVLDKSLQRTVGSYCPPMPVCCLSPYQASSI